MPLESLPYSHFLHTSSALLCFLPPLAVFTTEMLHHVSLGSEPSGTATYQVTAKLLDTHCMHQAPLLMCLQGWSIIMNNSDSTHYSESEKGPECNSSFELSYCSTQSLSQFILPAEKRYCRAGLRHWGLASPEGMVRLGKLQYLTGRRGCWEGVGRHLHSFSCKSSPGHTAACVFGL